MTVPPYKVLVLTCMVNYTAGTPMPRLCSVVRWSVHWAPSQTTQVLVLAGARRCTLEMCRKKKMQAALSGLAKSIIISCHLHTFCKPYVCRCILQLYFCSSWCWTISVLSVIVEFNRKRKSLLWFSFLFLGGGKGWGGGARLEQKVLTEKLFLSQLFNDLF